MSTYLEWLPAETLAIVFHDFQYPYLMNIKRALETKIFSEEFFHYLCINKCPEAIIIKAQEDTWEYVFRYKKYSYIPGDELDNYIKELLSVHWSFYTRFPFLYDMFYSKIKDPRELREALQSLDKIDPEKLYSQPYTRKTYTHYTCIYADPDFLNLWKYSQKDRLRDNKVLFWYFKTGKTRQYKITTMFTLDPVLFKLILLEPRFEISEEIIAKFLMYLYYTMREGFRSTLSILNIDRIASIDTRRYKVRYPDKLQISTHNNPDIQEMAFCPSNSIHMNILGASFEQYIMEERTDNYFKNDY